MATRTRGGEENESNFFRSLCDAKLAGHSSGVMQNHFVTPAGCGPHDSRNSQVHPVTESTSINEVWPPPQFVSYQLVCEQIGPKFHGLGEPGPPLGTSSLPSPGFQQQTPQQNTLARESSAVQRKIRKHKMLEKQKAQNRASSNRGNKSISGSKAPYSQGLPATPSNQFATAGRERQADVKPNGTTLVLNSESPGSHPGFSAPSNKSLQLGQGNASSSR